MLSWMPAWLTSDRKLPVNSSRVLEIEDEIELKEKMSEGKDPAIKLFGRQIPLQEDKSPIQEEGAADLDPTMELEKEKDTSKEKSNLELISSVPSNPTEATTETSSETPKSAEQDDHNKESSISDQNKLLKKPDKILPCPRCNSMDTKFCYYNNYNVNQPRHFCKNCQRYWTAGGSMRNVPVGAGRRKNKHGSSAARLTAIPIPSDALSDGVGVSDSINSLSNNGTVLRFGSDAPLCESMASMLNLGDQNSENQDETSCSSAGKSEENNQMNSFNSNGITTFPQLQYFPTPLYAYPWNPSWNNNLQWNHTPLFTSLPFPFPPFWNWNLPSSPPKTSTHCSINPNQTLGKHSREDQTEKSLWIPKTLRIDDPDEAAKSSIFATLGIECDEGNKFKAFSFKKNGNRKANEEEDEDLNTSQLMRANPAASSRSRSFQEMNS